MSTGVVIVCYNTPERNRGLKLVQVEDYGKRLFHEGLATRKIAGWWRKGFNGKEGV